MKNISKIIFLLLVSISFNACTKDEVVAPAQSFDSYLNANADLTMFKSLVDKAQLDDFKNGPGPFTWLAINNAGFAASGINQDSINRMTAGQANYLVMYHLINASYAQIDMITKNSIPRSTQLGTTASGLVYIGKKGNDNYINGSKIVSIDNKVSNGFVHVLNRVNRPPNYVGNIQAILTNTGQHSIFIAALTRAGLWAQFGTTSAFTVMAPTNTAMTAAGLDLAAVTAMNITTLTNTLRYHYFVSNRLFNCDFDKGVTPQTGLPGRALTIGGNGTTLKGTNNMTPVTITTFDMFGTNGVVHILDGVLRP